MEINDESMDIKFEVYYNIESEKRKENQNI